MGPTTTRSELLDLVMHLGLLGAAWGAIERLCRFRPAIYVRLVTEDQWGEYFTALGFALGGACFLLLALRASSSLTRVIAAAAGLGGMLVAGEEISWGQRIFEWTTPEILARHNLQGELTLHNLEAIHEPTLWGMAGAALLGISLASAVSFVVRQRRRPKQAFALARLTSNWFPLHVLPLLLLPFVVHRQWPLPNTSELCELLLGFGFATWGCDTLRRHGRSWTGCPAPAATLLVFLFVGTGAAALTVAFPGYLGWRLNFCAAYDFPATGMPEQAELLFEYIEAHPEHRTEDTGIRYARLLLDLGRPEQADAVLGRAEEDLRLRTVFQDGPAEHSLRRGIIARMRGRHQEAERLFALSDQARRDETEDDPDGQALLLWSEARTLHARGRSSDAIVRAQQALQLGSSPALAGKIGRWIEAASSREPYQPWWRALWPEFAVS